MCMSYVAVKAGNSTERKFTLLLVRPPTVIAMDAGWPLYVHGIVRLVRTQNVLKCVTMQTKTQNKPKSHKLRLRCCSEHTKIKMITTESLTYLSSNQSRNKLIRTCKSGSIPKSGFHRFSSRNREFVNSMLNLFL